MLSKCHHINFIIPITIIPTTNTPELRIQVTCSSDESTITFTIPGNGGNKD